MGTQWYQVTLNLVTKLSKLSQDMDFPSGFGGSNKVLV